MYVLYKNSKERPTIMLLDTNETKIQELERKLAAALALAKHWEAEFDEAHDQGYNQAVHDSCGCFRGGG